MLKLWTDRVQGGDGKELYGEDYADIWAINRLHFKAASPLFCDHVSESSKVRGALSFLYVFYVVFQLWITGPDYGHSRISV